MIRGKTSVQPMVWYGMVWYGMVWYVCMYVCKHIYIYILICIEAKLKLPKGDKQMLSTFSGLQTLKNLTIKTRSCWNKRDYLKFAKFTNLPENSHVP